MQEKIVASDVKMGYHDSCAMALRDTPQWKQAAALIERLNGVPVPPLGDFGEDSALLRRTLAGFVNAWLDAGKNTRECFRLYPEIERKVVALLRRHPLIVLAAVEGQSLLAWPIYAFRGSVKPAMRARLLATRQFVELIRNPLCERLGKCQRCGRYFLGRVGQKSCPAPRRCGSQLAALTAAKRARAERRTAELQRVRHACAAWETSNTRKDWKHWVARRVGVTPKWLTHQINRSDLKPPLKKEKKR